MTYYQELQKAKEAKINLFDVNIASTTEDWLNNTSIKCNEEIFNKACEVVKENYLKADRGITVDMIVEALLSHVNYDLVKYDAEVGIDTIGKYELLEEIED